MNFLAKMSFDIPLVEITKRPGFLKTEKLIAEMYRKSQNSEGLAIYADLKAMSLVHVEKMQNELMKIREQKGFPIYGFCPSRVTLQTYYLLSIADRIWTMPGALFRLRKNIYFQNSQQFLKNIKISSHRVASHENLFQNFDKKVYKGDEDAQILSSFPNKMHPVIFKQAMRNRQKYFDISKVMKLKKLEKQIQQMQLKQKFDQALQKMGQITKNNQQNPSVSTNLANTEQNMENFLIQNMLSRYKTLHSSYIPFKQKYPNKRAPSSLQYEQIPSLMTSEQAMELGLVDHQDQIREAMRRLIPFKKLHDGAFNTRKRVKILARFGIIISPIIMIIFLIKVIIKYSIIIKAYLGIHDQQTDKYLKDLERQKQEQQKKNKQNMVNSGSSTDKAYLSQSNEYENEYEQE